ncbi:hypothetical protein [Aquimarina sp. 2201CG14-23]|uniref:hypothetical protein n=1 Tax=Aquimarina mycalae TaxID=3040073 RepID=UPI002477E608|nr:hypothetical protein [Aquimarina sp. 2201CG14-23]MDH7447096.1 hypothetical protein [Aquimarina sp. 2201CG14-23]
MEVQKIKSKLESLGYIMFDKEDYIWGGIEGDEGPIPESKIINSAFNIFVIDNKATVVMLNATVGEKKEFENLEDLVQFVTSTVPI